MMPGSPAGKLQEGTKAVTIARENQPWPAHLMISIAENLAPLAQRISDAELRHGRLPGSVTLLAVSKGQSAERIRAAHQAGLRHFGESYLQEALPKQAVLADLDLCWHFIGSLQANKSRAVARHFDWLHSLDRLSLAQRLDAQRPAALPPLNVLIQVNFEGAAGRGGVPPAELPRLAEQIGQLPRLRLRGLMTLPLRGEALLPHPFEQLAELLRQLNGSGHQLDALSMGMSDDFEAAIIAGANWIRIGTALFGQRPMQPDHSTAQPQYG